jgi:hypothetical protein
MSANIRRHDVVEWKLLLTSDMTENLVQPGLPDPLSIRIAPFRAIARVWPKLHLPLRVLHLPNHPNNSRKRLFRPANELLSFLPSRSGPDKSRLKRQTPPDQPPCILPRIAGEGLDPVEVEVGELEDVDWAFAFVRRVEERARADGVGKEDEELGEESGRVVLILIWGKGRIWGSDGLYALTEDGIVLDRRTRRRGESVDASSREMGQGRMAFIGGSRLGHGGFYDGRVREQNMRR